MQICSHFYPGDWGMYVSSLISFAPLTPGTITEQGRGMKTRYSQPMILQLQDNQSIQSAQFLSTQHNAAIRYSTRLW